MEMYMWLEKMQLWVNFLPCQIVVSNLVFLYKILENVYIQSIRLCDKFDGRGVCPNIIL